MTADYSGLGGNKTLGTQGESLPIAIIGGGPTGLGTALFLAQQQRSVWVIERGQWPVDKVCGEGIMPTGVETLRRLGVLERLDNQHFFPFKGIRYVDPSGITAEGEFQRGPGYGVRRLSLSQALYESAQAHPQITLLSQTEFLNFTEDDKGIWPQVQLKGQDAVVVAPETLMADQGGGKKEVTRLGPFAYLLACDGLHSRVRKSLRLDGPSPGKQKRLGTRIHFAIPPWSDKVEVWWQKGIEAYVTPLSPGEIELAFIWDHDQVHIKPHHGEGPGGPLSFFPELQRRVAGAKMTSTWRSLGPLAQGALCPQRGKIVFLGDAYLFLDGITGEGISMGLAHGRLFSHILNKYGGHMIEEAWSEYARGVHRLYAPYLRMTHLALYFTRHHRLRKWAIRLLSLFPFLFHWLLELNLGPQGARKH